MQIATIGIDIAKHVFQVHGVSPDGQVVLQKRLRRTDVLRFFEQLDSCLVGMEACATAHHWARELEALGHRVKLMPPTYVKAYIRRNKNDAADAEAAEGGLEDGDRLPATWAPSPCRIAAASDNLPIPALPPVALTNSHAALTLGATLVPIFGLIRNDSSRPYDRYGPTRTDHGQSYPTPSSRQFFAPKPVLHEGDS